MSEISIQIRRITEKVKDYFSIFGLRPYARMSPGRATIKGTKRLGFDEIECVVAESARGTSVGFYGINQLQGLIHSIPFLFLILLTGLTQIQNLNKFISGQGNLSINIVSLFGGNASFTFKFIILMLAFASIFALTDYLVQKLRLENLKSRFSFYSRDAIWNTREIPPSLTSLQAIRSIFMHAWVLAILYFGAFASTSNTLIDLEGIYSASSSELLSATIDAFTITVGLVVGLLTSYKSITLRKQYSRIDDRSKISGSIMERRIDPILFGIQSAILNGILLSIFFSVTFLSGATSAQIVQFLIFIVIGAVIAGFLHEEGHMWMMASYAIFIFFTSMLLIFRTGGQSAYAYIVVVQLFFVPIPFILIASNYFGEILKEEDITTKEWIYDIFPITAFISLILSKRKREQAIRDYEESMEEEVSAKQIDSKIYISKEILQDKSSNAYKMVRHYFELVFTYSASYGEDQFVILPTTSQLQQWWTTRSDMKFSEENKEFIEVTDQLLWDPSYIPEDENLTKYEEIGKEMVIAIN